MPYGNERSQTLFLDEAGWKAFLDEIRERYPAEKPVCFNYSRAREDVFLLCDMVKELSGSTKNQM